MLSFLKPSGGGHINQPVWGKPANPGLRINQTHSLLSGTNPQRSSHNKKNKNKKLFQHQGEKLLKNRNNYTIQLKFYSYGFEPNSQDWD